ncbi:uncharacterized protein ColSpa_03120 [Colletotrichum spaethianum]|uniref:Uncharacterized protein n=1 Tax=Colletotrichum spaethianum TaxID=700344 RepID=A0AA37L928_9PEZI|nr:uncharacterized protein ColSpa_03120 [Colletotrichum spaethianum]GKT42939.1 hypothetical protein ColSpa_03120 [Colletotrichum spaethianum]
MLAYGYNARRSTHVSIVCPDHARDVIKSWAVATSDVNGYVWKVTIESIAHDDNFETLLTVSLGFGDAGVLMNIFTMPALVNQIAVAYLLGERAAREMCPNNLAGDLIWLLEKICKDDQPEQQLTTRNVPAARNTTFWIDFTTAYPELPGLFYAAGFL